MIIKAESHATYLRRQIRELQAELEQYEEETS